MMTKCLVGLIMHGFKLRLVIKARVALFDGGTSIWKFGNVYLAILHARDKRCKTLGTSLRTPNFIVAVKSDILCDSGSRLTERGS